MQEESGWKCLNSQFSRNTCCKQKIPQKIKSFKYYSSRTKIISQFYERNYWKKDNKIRLTWVLLSCLNSLSFTLLRFKEHFTKNPLNKNVSQGCVGSSNRSWQITGKNHPSKCKCTSNDQLLGGIIRRIRQELDANEVTIKYGFDHKITMIWFLRRS